MFKVGDKVRVTERTCPNVWTNLMDEAIGNEYEITKICSYKEDNMYYLSFRNSMYYFPETSLEYVVIIDTYKEWYRQAKEKNIHGRSRMTKAQLKEAVLKCKEEEENFSIGEILRKKVRDKQSCCHYATEEENGARHYNVSAICHVGLNYVKNTKHFVDDIGFNLANPNIANKEVYKEFVHYMLNESSWKDCFLTKNVEKALKEGVYYDVDEDYNRVVVSAIALRQGGEHSERLLAFKRFKELGYSSNVSWCLAQMLLYVNNKWLLQMFSGGHDVFQGAMKIDSFFKFFKEGFYNAKTVPFKERNAHYKIFLTVCPDYNSTEKDNITNYVANFFAGNIYEEKGAFGIWNQYVKEEAVLKFAEHVKGLIE